MLLEHKVGIVTGSSKGIGRCIAEELARQGADLIINGNNEAMLEDVRQTIVDIGRKCQIVRGDISDYETSLALRHCAEEEFGRVDILVNNAGINDRTSTMELTAFCAAERPPVRLPAATQRYQRPGVNQPLSAQS